MSGAAQPITIEVNDAEIQAALKRLLNAIKDSNPAFREIGEILIQSTKQRFVDSRDPQGNPWQQLSDATLLRAIGKRGLSKKFTKTGGHTLTKGGASRLANKKILVQRRYLRDTLRYRVLKKDGVMVGTNRIYGATHQFGRDHIPARPFLGISATDRINIIDILRKHLAAS